MALTLSEFIRKNNISTQCECGYDFTYMPDLQYCGNCGQARPGRIIIKKFLDLSKEDYNAKTI